MNQQKYIHWCMFHVYTSIIWTIIWNNLSTMTVYDLHWGLFSISFWYLGRHWHHHNWKDFPTSGGYPGKLTGFPYFQNFNHILFCCKARLYIVWCYQRPQGCGGENAWAPRAQSSFRFEHLHVNMLCMCACVFLLLYLKTQVYFGSCLFLLP